jgi:hypothetical protein
MKCTALQKRYKGYNMAAVYAFMHTLRKTKIPWPTLPEAVDDDSQFPEELKINQKKVKNDQKEPQKN